MEENKEIQLRSVEQFVHAGSLLLETAFCLFAFCFPFPIYLLANINILPFAIKYFPFISNKKYLKMWKRGKSSRNGLIQTLLYIP